MRFVSMICHPCISKKVVPLGRDTISLCRFQGHFFEEHITLVIANLIWRWAGSSSKILSDKTCVCTNRVFVPRVHTSPWRTEIVEMEEKKWHMCKNNFVERKDLIRHYQEDRWMDLSELQSMYSLHIEGTNALVMGDLGWKWWFAGRGHKNECH